MSKFVADSDQSTLEFSKRHKKQKQNKTKQKKQTNKKKKTNKNFSLKCAAIILKILEN